MDDPEVHFYRKAAEDTVLALKYLAAQNKIDLSTSEGRAEAKKLILAKAEETRFDPLLSTGN